MASKPLEGTSLIACLQELWPDFQLTEANQMNPTSDIAIKFYERFICGQLKIEIGELEKMLLEKASCPDAFANILNVYTLYLCTATVIEKLGLNELLQTFGLTHLLSPIRKKFKMSLILLSNCVIYVTSLQETMEDIKYKVFQALQSFKDNKDKIDELKERKNCAAILHTKNTRKMEDLQNRKDLLYKNIRSIQEEFERIKEETTVEELDFHQIKSQYEIIEAKLNDYLKIEHELKSEIVENYQSISDKKDRLLKERNELLADSKKNDTILNEKMQKLTSYKENLNFTKQFLETIPLDKLLEKYEILHEYNSEITQHQNEIKSLQETESLDLDALKQFQDMKDSLEQKIQECTTENQNKMKISDKEFDELQNDINLEQDKKSKSMEFSNKVDVKIQEANECLQQYEGQIKNQNVYFDTRYKKILELKGEFDNKVLALINKVGHVLNKKK